MKFVNRVGEIHTTNEGYSVVIIECFSTHNCTIQFENGTVIKNRYYKDMLRGNVKNPYHPSVCNIGYNGVGKYSNKTHRGAYTAWYNMLFRCYNEKEQEKHPTYKDCTVVDEWYNLQVFAEWYENNYTEGFELDKDILVKGNKVYSPKTCRLIPKEIDTVLVSCNKSRGELPIGVMKHENKFEVQISNKGVKGWVGYFNTIQEAFQAYKKTKEKIIKKLSDKYRQQIAEDIYQALYNYQVEIDD